MLARLGVDPDRRLGQVGGVLVVALELRGVAAAEAVLGDPLAGEGEAGLVAPMKRP